MAQPVITAAGDAVELLAVWSDEGVRVGDVLAALEALRRPEPMPATRASVLSLVVVATSVDSAARAREAVHGLSGHHPARAVTLLVDTASTAGRSRLDAEVRLMGGVSAGHQLWFEDIELHVGGQVIRHLDSLIEPLTHPDLPVVVWFVDALPAPDDPLLVAADVAVIDARDFGEVECFATVAALIERAPVVDLSWVRLQPWRQMLADLFEGPVFRPFVTGARSAEVSGRTGPRHLLAGWLVDRLGLEPSTVRLETAEHVRMHISAVGPPGTVGTFTVDRAGDERVVRARASIEGGAAAASVCRLPEATPSWGLAAALSRLERDPVYERALHASMSRFDAAYGMELQHGRHDGRPGAS